MKLFSKFCLIHVNRKFDSQDMVFYTLHSCRCLKNNYINEKQVKQKKSTTDWLRQWLSVWNSLKLCIIPFLQKCCQIWIANISKFENWKITPHLSFVFVVVFVLFCFFFCMFLTKHSAQFFLILPWIDKLRISHNESGMEANIRGLVT